MKEKPGYPRPKSFREAVVLMRAAQRNYFREHTQTTLNTAMYYERMVDEWLKKHPDVPETQLELPKG